MSHSNYYRVLQLTFCLFASQKDLSSWAFSLNSPSSWRPSFVLFAKKQASTDLSRIKRLPNLSQWVNDSEIQIGGVQIQAGNEDGSGLGLVATQTLKTGDLLVSVPSKVALSVEGPRDGPDDRGVLSCFQDRKVLRDAPWFAQFAIYLNVLDKLPSISQKGLDMRAWIDSLPRKFDTPIHWSHLDDLQYQHMSQAVERQTNEWNGLYQQLLAAATPDLTLSYDDFVWGCECARSRAFSGAYTGSAFNPLVYAFTLLLVTAYVGLNLGTLEQAANGAALVICASILKDFVLPKLFKKKRFVICPVIDMANHRSLGTTADVSFEFFGDAYSLAVSEGVSVPKDSEVFISYGARSNDQLLQYYGFVEPDNPHDVYIMPPLREWDIEALEQACGRSFSPGRLQKLDRAGLLGQTTTALDTSDDSTGNPMGGVVLTRATGMDPAVLQALRALVSTDSEWEAAGEAIGNFAAEFSGGPANEQTARLAAKTAIELELASKPTTLEEDKALLSQMTKSKSLDSSPEEILAVSFRIEKKQLLLEAIKALE